ncbi:MAG: aspartate 1-decarboxylase [Synergistetes bacterium]|nr:aspartate 1-decarboxylase [Synergistota bacterium]
MLRRVLISKIHRATVTDSNLNYEGSITIDRNLMEIAGILPYEEVLIADIDNGSRFTTYVIEGEGGEVCLNGAAARKVAIGDKVIIMAFGLVEEKEAKKIKPKIIHVDDKNRPVKS